MALLVVGAGVVTHLKHMLLAAARKYTLAMLLLMGSVLGTLVLLEASLRLAPSLLPAGARLHLHWQEARAIWYIPHPYIGHLHSPSAHASFRTVRPSVEVQSHYDQWGFRNSWPWPKQVDILAVGDSLTYGQMVHEGQAWTTLLARELPASRILNLGLIGAAPQQYLRIYETVGVNLTPKVLLVGLFLGNDLWGAREFDRWWKSGGHGAFPEFGRQDTATGIGGWVARGVRRLYLVTLLRDLRASYRSGRLLSGQTVHLSSGQRLQVVPRLLTQMARYAHPTRQEFSLVLETLEHLHALARHRDTSCVVLFFPSKEEVYLPALHGQVPDLAASFIPELEKRNIPYLDLGPYFRQRAARGEQLFFEVDGHPNAQGYALIAQVVASYLKDHARSYGLQDGQNAALAGGR